MKLQLGDSVYWGKDGNIITRRNKVCAGIVTRIIKKTKKYTTAEIAISMIHGIPTFTTINKINHSS